MWNGVCKGTNTSFCHPWYIIAEKHWKCHFLENRKYKYGGNMRNRLFVPVFDFYANMGSIGTPSALSNVSRAGLWKFRAKRTKCRFCFFFLYLIALYRKSRKARETIFGSSVAGLVLYWYSSKYLLCSIYYADRWHCSFADRKTAMKHVQGGKVWAFLLPASRIVTPSKLKLCPWCTSSKKSFHFPLRDTFSSWEITRWIV